MLLRTLFLLLLLAVLGETIAHGAAALAQAALHQRAVDAARVAFVTGTHAVQASVAQVVSVHPQASVFPAPAPISTCAYAGTNGCEMNVLTTFSTPAPAITATPAACPGTDCIVELQGNSLVSEARATFLISATVTAPGGAPLASRTGEIALRTFGTAPWASVVGSSDSTLDALMNGGAGDDAGSNATSITVEYDPHGGGSATAGNVWQSRVESPASAAPNWDH